LYNNPFIIRSIKNHCGELTMNKLLSKALKNAFNMRKEDANSLAETVECIFNGKEEIEDMKIDKYARALFYELQREKLLKIRREEYKENGKCMRKFYWSFNKKQIKIDAFKKITEDQYKIYKKIPEKAWLIRSCCT
jgi:NRPS condensation-like uncharacterized protein